MTHLLQVELGHDLSQLDEFLYVLLDLLVVSKLLVAVPTYQITKVVINNVLTLLLISNVLTLLLISNVLTLLFTLLVLIYRGETDVFERSFLIKLYRLVLDQVGR